MARFQCRKEAAKMRERFLPKPTTKAEVKAMAINMRNAQEGHEDPLLKSFDKIPGFGPEVVKGESGVKPKKSAKEIKGKKEVGDDHPEESTTTENKEQTKEGD